MNTEEPELTIIEKLRALRFIKGISLRMQLYEPSAYFRDRDRTLTNNGVDVYDIHGTPPSEIYITYPEYLYVLKVLDQYLNDDPKYNDISPVTTISPPSQVTRKHHVRVITEKMHENCKHITRGIKIDKLLDDLFNK